MCRWNGKALIQREDRLLRIPEGMGCLLLRTENRGPWYQKERLMHINRLELLAATLSNKTFAKSKTVISILLRIDNTTAVAFINNLGATASKELVMLTRDLWMWCLERNIHITAVHLPGVLNTIANTESREMTDWKLNPTISTVFMGLNLFASRLSTLLQLPARSICTCNRCLSSGLDSQCQSFM